MFSVIAKFAKAVYFKKTNFSTDFESNLHFRDYFQHFCLIASINHHKSSINYFNEITKPIKKKNVLRSRLNSIDRTLLWFNLGFLFRGLRFWGTFIHPLYLVSLRFCTTAKEPRQSQQKLRPKFGNWSGVFFKVLWEQRQKPEEKK